jgi:maleate isomerase
MIGDHGAGIRQWWRSARMVDSLGYRAKFAVLAPSTNTSVQPEFDEMRPPGVTNHFSRIFIPNNTVKNDQDFLKLMDDIRAALMDAVDVVMTCEPDYVVMGMSAETFWDGLEGSKQLQDRLETRSGKRVAMGSDASQAALKAYGGIKRIAVITPYMPVGDENVRKFFTDTGFEVRRLFGFKCTSPTAIAHVSTDQLRQAIREIDGPDVDAIVQVGTNLAMARLAAEAERWLAKPVIAINAATYWYALRQNRFMDKIPGFGRLLEEF